MTRSNMGTKGFIYLASTSLFITKGTQDRNSDRAGTCRLELMQRPWRGAASWLVLRDLHSLISYRTQGHQSSGILTHNGLGPPPLITS